MSYWSEQFERTELLIGQLGLEKLRQSSVLIFGIGGVGSYTAEALARAGVGELTLVDADDISLSNLNRQLHALHSTIGRSKVEVMKARILDINPDAEVHAIKHFYVPEDAGRFLAEKIDYVVDAIDDVAAKVSLARECSMRRIPFIASMGAGNRLQAENFQIADLKDTYGCPLAKAVRKQLRQVGITTGIKVIFSPDLPLKAERTAPAEKDKNISENENMNSENENLSKKRVPGSVSFVPSVAGLLAAGEVVRDLISR